MRRLLGFTRWIPGLLCTLCLVGCVGTFFGTEMPERLRTHGVAADAKILRVWDTGWTVNDDPVIGMRVEVMPTDRTHFEATIKRYMISRLAVCEFRPGAVIKVRFDPDEPAIITVDTTIAGAHAASDREVSH